MARRFRQTGVVGGSLNQLAVSADGSAMAVSVASGDAFLVGFFYRNDAALALTIAAANATNPRIDTVVVRLDRVANTAVLAVVTGTAATSPVAPTLSQTDSLYELPLADVRVPAAAGVITAPDVTDRRKITQTFDSAAYTAGALKDEDDAEESTTSTVYDGLASAHEVTITTGPTGQLLLHYTAAVRGSAAGVVGYTAPLIIRTSDSVTVAAADDARAIYLEGTAAQRQGGAYLFNGAANTQYRIVMRYRTSSGTAFFSRRSLVVLRST